MADRDTGDLFEGDILEDSKDDLKEPDLYKVLLHNDHYTTMDFVVEILRGVFNKHLLEATKIMLDVHRKGIGVVGMYTFDIAQTKTRQVTEIAKRRDFPLKCTFERA